MSDIFHRPEYSKHEDMEEDDLVGTPYNGQLKDLGVSETRARTGAGFGAHHFSLSRYGGVNGAGNQVIDGSYHVGEDGTVYDNSFFLSDGSLSFANGCARGDQNMELCVHPRLDLVSAAEAHVHARARVRKLECKHTFAQTHHVCTDTHALAARA